MHPNFLGPFRVHLAAAFLIVSLPGLAAAQAPAAPPAAGHWEGAIQLPGHDLLVKVDLTPGDGEWKGTIDIPEQGATGLPLEKVAVDGGHVRFAITGIPGNPTFDGTLENGKIAGTFTQGQASIPFHLGRDAVKPARRPQDPEPPFPYTEEEAAYQNGDVHLAGTLTLPPGPGPFPAVVLISGSGAQNRNEELLGHRPFLVLADHLSRNGIAVLRVDDRGVGGSTGSVNESTSSDFAGDVLAGVQFLKKHPRIAPGRIGLVGHSEGGLIAPLAATRSTDVAFIVLLAGTGTTGYDLLPGQVEAIDKASGMTEDKARKEADLTRAGLDLVRAEKDPAALRAKLKKLFAERSDAFDPKDVEAGGGLDAFVDQQAKALSSPWFRYFLDYDPRPVLRRVKVPVLALNGELDRQVLVDQNLPAIEQALREGKNPDVTVRRMPGLNHLFQTAKTGSVKEYATIDETLSPAVLDVVTRWILERFGKPAPAAKPAG
jgi:pimeloyl-ACP methyl ester carboxylesterase